MGLTTLGLSAPSPHLENPWGRAFARLARPWPLLRYLVLETETHALCAAIAFFSSLAFYPTSFLLLALTRKVAEWGSGPQQVVVAALREFYPEGQGFLLYNLGVSVAQYGRTLGPAAAFWILVGAAGVFVPLETALNRLWGFPTHRPYWKNQLVGLVLTLAGIALALGFVLATSGLQAVLSAAMPSGFMARLAAYAVFRACALAAVVAAITLLFRWLPNGPVVVADVFPAALVAGLTTEVVRSVFIRVLPLLGLARSQGPYYVSVSFALLVYVQAFVVLGAGFLAVPTAEEPGGATPP